MQMTTYRREALLGPASAGVTFGVSALQSARRLSQADGDRG
jgi:hypothetical protein